MFEVLKQCSRSIGFGRDAHSTLSALWSFIEADGFPDDFLTLFDRFYLLPAWDPKECDAQKLEMKH